MVRWWSKETNRSCLLSLAGFRTPCTNRRKVIKDAHGAIVTLSNGAFFPVNSVVASDSDKYLAILKSQRQESAVLGNWRCGEPACGRPPAASYVQRRAENPVGYYGA